MTKVGSECIKAGKWLCATLCRLEIGVERLAYEVAASPKFWKKRVEDDRSQFQFDAQSVACAR